MPIVVFVDTCCSRNKATCFQEARQLKLGRPLLTCFQLIKVQESEVEALLLNLSRVNGSCSIVLNGPSSFPPLETASDCHELFLRGETTSGVYTIQPDNAEPFKVFCEMTAGKMDDLDQRFESIRCSGSWSDGSLWSSSSRWRLDSDTETPGRLSGLRSAVGGLCEGLWQPDR